MNNSNGQPQRMRNIPTGGGRNYSADNANHIRWEGGKVVHIQDNTIERQHTRGINI